MVRFTRYAISTVVTLIIVTSLVTNLSILGVVLPKPLHVTVVIDPNIFRVIGNNYDGFGYIYFTYGNVSVISGISSETLKILKEGRAVVASLGIAQRYVRELQSLAKKLENLARKGYSIILPTVGLTLFLYGPNGTEKICSAALSLWNFRSLGFRRLITTIVRRGVVLRIESRDLVCGTINVSQLDKDLVSELKNIGISAEEGKYGLISIGEPPSALARESTESGSARELGNNNRDYCPPYREEVYNWVLYNSRFNPPRGWIDRLEGASVRYAKCLWYIFAVRYSKRYFYNADLYTRDQALYHASMALGSGVMTMQQLIHRLAQFCGGYEPKWRYTIAGGKLYTIDMPWMGISMYLTQNSSYLRNLDSYAALSATQFSYEYAGLTMFGVPIYEKSYWVSLHRVEAISVGGENERDYIVAPTVLMYEGDGIIVHLNYAYVVDSNGCRWHVIWPEISFVPIYSIVAVDWKNMHVVSLGYDKYLKHFEDLSWTAHEELVYSGYAGSSKGVIYTDSSSSVEARGGAGLVAESLSLYKPWFDKVIEGILDSLSSPLAKEMISFTIAGVSFAQFIIGTVGLSYVMHVKVLYPGTHEYPVSIYKLTCPDVLAKEYKRLGYVPYIEYDIVVGYVSAPRGAR